ncbi:MAG: hypothetical protein RSC24_06360 [Clostridium sp.]
MLIGFILGILATYIVLFFIPNMVLGWTFLGWYIFRPDNIWDTLKESFLEFIVINRL